MYFYCYYYQSAYLYLKIIYNKIKKMQGKIKEVYEDEMPQEIRKMSELIERYNYISIVSFF
jgi:hypothetical protein